MMTTSQNKLERMERLHPVRQGRTLKVTNKTFADFCYISKNAGQSSITFAQIIIIMTAFRANIKTSFNMTGFQTDSNVYLVNSDFSFRNQATLFFYESRYSGFTSVSIH